jgi:hypothetical protein
MSTPAGDGVQCGPCAARSQDEIREIGALKDIQEMWGAIDAAEMEMFLKDMVYAVKFDSNAKPVSSSGDTGIKRDTR